MSVNALRNGDINFTQITFLLSDQDVELNVVLLEFTQVHEVHLCSLLWPAMWRALSSQLPHHIPLNFRPIGLTDRPTSFSRYDTDEFYCPCILSSGPLNLAP